MAEELEERVDPNAGRGETKGKSRSSSVNDDDNNNNAESESSKPLDSKDINTVLHDGGLQKLLALLSQNLVTKSLKTSH